MKMTIQIEKIQEICEKFPSCYTKKIKKHHELMQCIGNHPLVKHLPNLDLKEKIVAIKKGFGFCGHANE